MKRELSILVASASIVMTGLGCGVFADEGKNTKSNLEYVKILNDVRETTSKVEYYGADTVVGQVKNSGCKIRRELTEDKNKKIMHMVDNIMDPEKGPVQIEDQWYDINKNVEYYYDYNMKKYMIDPDNDGWYEKERLNIDSYYLEHDDRKDESIVGEVKIDENVSLNVYRDEYSELDDVTLDVKGEKVPCRVIQYYEEYDCPVIYFINNTKLKVIGDDLSYEKEKDIWYNKVTDVYYIGKNDNRFYKIEHRLIRDDNPEVSTDIKFFYPKTKLSIPKKFKNKPMLAEETRIKKGDIEYEVVFKNNKAELKTYDVSSKKVLKKKTLTIPKYVSYCGRKYKVTEIGQKSFEEMRRLKKVYIKTKKLRKVGKGAFRISGKKKLVFFVPPSKKKAYKKLLNKAKTGKFVLKNL